MNIRVTKMSEIDKNQFISELNKRAGETDKRVTQAVSEIIENVKLRGDEAVRDYTIKFDGKAPECFEISKDELEKAYNSRDEKLITALKNAADNIRAFHENQKESGFMMDGALGVKVGQVVRGLNRVGLYVPGGTAAYPSSVLMNAIPAKIAGVNEVVMVTPPCADGTANPNILAAAYIAGVDRVFIVGGAQAVAALAVGTKSIPKVDKIVGPGNIYVATAKKLLYGVVDIDMIAGPSEILIVADDSARADFIAADMMSQAEHDVLASATLITTSQALAGDVVKELERQSALMSRCDIIRKSLEDYGMIMVCDTMEQAIDLANELAPEHMELVVENPEGWVNKIYNAGSLFLGAYSPEPVGDYYAGPNHVLPTSGTARFFSPLGVNSFVKRMGVIQYTEKALEKAKDDIVLLADTEGLTAHANAIKVRF